MVGDWFQIGVGNNCPCNAELRQITNVNGNVLSVAALSNAHASGEQIRIGALELTTTKTNSVQVAIRHSAKLGATIAVYGAASRILTRTLLDSKAPSIGNWSAESTVDSGFDDSENNFGGPQIAIDESNGDLQVFKAVTGGQGPSWTGICPTGWAT